MEEDGRGRVASVRQRIKEELASCERTRVDGNRYVFCPTAKYLCVNIEKEVQQLELKQTNESGRDEGSFQ